MLKVLLLLLTTVFASAIPYKYAIQEYVSPLNQCIQFSVAQGTGCDWMCNYCANQLGTYNYYFPDNVCTYQSGGCVGNPIAGKSYTCCSV